MEWGIIEFYDFQTPSKFLLLCNSFCLYKIHCENKCKLKILKHIKSRWGALSTWVKRKGKESSMCERNHLIHLPRCSIPGPFVQTYSGIAEWWPLLFGDASGKHLSVFEFRFCCCPAFVTISMIKFLYIRKFNNVNGRNKFNLDSSEDLF